MNSNHCKRQPELEGFLYPFEFAITFWRHLKLEAQTHSMLDQSHNSQNSMMDQDSPNKQKLGVSSSTGGPETGFQLGGVVLLKKPFISNRPRATHVLPRVGDFF